VGLESGPLSLVSTTEELLGRKNIGSGLENREYSCEDPRNMPWRRIGKWHVEFPTFSRQLPRRRWCRVVSPTLRPCFTPQKHY
jgi:hypothetical protein